MIKLLPLGGIDENGRYCYVVEIDDKIIVCQMGARVPEINELGVDYIVYPYDYLINNKDRIIGVIITHWSIETAGALPFIIDKIPDVKIFTSSLTKSCINDYINQLKIWKLKKLNINFVSIDENVEMSLVSDISVKFFQISSEFPTCFNFLIKSNCGNILFASDYVIGYKNMWNRKFNNYLENISGEKVDILLHDSSNILINNFISPNYSISESINKLIKKYKNKRRIVLIGDWNYFYFHEILRICSKLQLKLQLLNSRFLNTFKKISLRKYIDNLNVNIVTQDNLINEKHIVFIPTNDKLFYYDINKIFYRNKKLEIDENDLFINLMIKRAGYELHHTSIENMILKRKADYLNINFSNIHKISPAKEDFKMLCSYTNPNFIVPINATFNKLYKAKEMASIFVDNLNAPIVNNGQFAIFNTENNSVKLLPLSLKINDVYVDGIGVGDVNNLIIQERRIMSSNGILALIINIKNDELVLTDQTRIEFIGLDNDNIEIKKIIFYELEDIIKLFRDRDYYDIKKIIKSKLRKIIRKGLNKEPIILPVIISK